MSHVHRGAGIQRDWLLGSRATVLLPERSLLRVMFILQEGICRYCKKPMTPYMGSSGHAEGWSRDHVQPRVWGRGRARNTLLVHYSCNQAKGHAPPTPVAIAEALALYDRAAALHREWVARHLNNAQGPDLGVWLAERLAQGIAA